MKLGMPLLSLCFLLGCDSHKSVPRSSSPRESQRLERIASTITEVGTPLSVKGTFTHNIGSSSGHYGGNNATLLLSIRLETKVITAKGDIRGANWPSQVEPIEDLKRSIEYHLRSSTSSKEQPQIRLNGNYSVGNIFIIKRATYKGNDYLFDN